MEDPPEHARRIAYLESETAGLLAALKAFAVEHQGGEAALAGAAARLAIGGADELRAAADAIILQQQQRGTACGRRASSNSSSNPGSDEYVLTVLQDALADVDSTLCTLGALQVDGTAAAHMGSTVRALLALAGCLRASPPPQALAHGACFKAAIDARQHWAAAAAAGREAGAAALECAASLRLVPGKLSAAVRHQPPSCVEAGEAIERAVQCVGACASTLHDQAQGWGRGGGAADRITDGLGRVLAALKGGHPFSPTAASPSQQQGQQQQGQQELESTVAPESRARDRSVSAPGGPAPAGTAFEAGLIDGTGGNAADAPLPRWISDVGGAAGGRLSTGADAGQGSGHVKSAPRRIEAPSSPVPESPCGSSGGGGKDECSGGTQVGGAQQQQQQQQQQDAPEATGEPAIGRLLDAVHASQSALTELRASLARRASASPSASALVPSPAPAATASPSPLGRLSSPPTRVGATGSPSPPPALAALLDDLVAQCGALQHEMEQLRADAVGSGDDDGGGAGDGCFTGVCDSPQPGSTGTAAAAYDYTRFDNPLAEPSGAGAADAANALDEAPGGGLGDPAGRISPSLSAADSAADLGNPLAVFELFDALAVVRAGAPAALAGLGALELLPTPQLRAWAGPGRECVAAADEVRSAAARALAAIQAELARRREGARAGPPSPGSWRIAACYTPGRGGGDGGNDDGDGGEAGAPPPVAAAAAAAAAEVLKQADKTNALSPPISTASSAPPSDGEVASLRAQLAAAQAQIAKLTQRRRRQRQRRQAKTNKNSGGGDETGSSSSSGSEASSPLLVRKRQRGGSPAPVEISVASSPERHQPLLPRGSRLSDAAGGDVVSEQQQQQPAEEWAAHEARLAARSGAAEARLRQLLASGGVRLGGGALVGTVGADGRVTLRLPVDQPRPAGLDGVGPGSCSSDGSDDDDESSSSSSSNGSNAATVPYAPLDEDAPADDAGGSASSPPRPQRRSSSQIVAAVLAGTELPDGNGDGGDGGAVLERALSREASAAAADAHLSIAALRHQLDALPSRRGSGDGDDADEGPEGDGTPAWARAAREVDEQMRCELDALTDALGGLARAAVVAGAPAPVTAAIEPAAASPLLPQQQVQAPPDDGTQQQALTVLLQRDLQAKAAIIGDLSARMAALLPEAAAAEGLRARLARCEADCAALREEAARLADTLARAAEAGAEREEQLRRAREEVGLLQAERGALAAARAENAELLRSICRVGGGEGERGAAGSANDAASATAHAAASAALQRRVSSGVAHHYRTLTRTRSDPALGSGGGAGLPIWDVEAAAAAEACGASVEATAETMRQLSLRRREAEALQEALAAARGELAIAHEDAIALRTALAERDDALADAAADLELARREAAHFRAGHADLEQAAAAAAAASRGAFMEARARLRSPSGAVSACDEDDAAVEGGALAAARKALAERDGEVARLSDALGVLQAAMVEWQCAPPAQPPSAAGGGGGGGGDCAPARTLSGDEGCAAASAAVAPSAAAEAREAALRAQHFEEVAALRALLLDVQAAADARAAEAARREAAADRRVGAGYARTEELRRLHRELAAAGAEVQRLRARARMAAEQIEALRGAGCSRCCGAAAASTSPRQQQQQQRLSPVARAAATIRSASGNAELPRAPAAAMQQRSPAPPPPKAAASSPARQPWRPAAAPSRGAAASTASPAAAASARPRSASVANSVRALSGGAAHRASPAKKPST